MVLKYLTTVLSSLILASFLAAQSPPPHPRMLFRASDVPALSAKVTAPGTASAAAYAQCSTTAALQSLGGGLPSVSSQTHWSVAQSLRRMQEAALHYALTGNTAAGQAARATLLQCVNLLTPTGASAYRNSTYPAAMGITFDMVYPLLTSSEVSQVVSRLESWIVTLKSGNNGWAYYTSYAGATDNHVMGWATGIAIAGMAIWGHSSMGSLLSDIDVAVNKLRAGWLDTISPDGSVDESYGYAGYGNLYAIYVGICAQNCGLGDPLGNTNILKTPVWVGASVFENGFMWHGDSSPSHKGNRIDPILYYIVNRNQSAQQLWCLERIYAVEAASDNTPTQAFSPYLPKALWYPEGVAPQAPALLSSFFRDNLNQGSSTGNKTTCYPQVGLGGQAYLHNSPLANATQMGVLYQIRDEWVNHGHEDDGNLCITSQGQQIWLDLGYAGTSGWFGAQTPNHNIVLTQGVAEFAGSSNNYYSPPEPNGRFLGEKKGLALGGTLDYVRGSHNHMWQMQKASRSVIMIKDTSEPYVILIDDVNRDGSNQTFEQIFHASSAAFGAGTDTNPMICYAGSAALKSVYLAPWTPNIAPGGQTTSPGGISHARNRVIASGSNVTFMSVNGRTSPSSRASLNSPLATTRGGRVTWPSGRVDKLMATVGGALGDNETSSDGQFVWLRSSAGQLTEWVAAEAMGLVHQGQTLLASNLRLIVSVRQNSVEITTPSGTGIQGLQLTLRVPFSVVAFKVDGVTQPFTQIGGEITIGGPSLPTPSTDDRFYAFSTGFEDSQPSTNAIITPGGQMTSTGGWAYIKLRGGDSFLGRPLDLGLSLQFLPGASGDEVAFKIETIPSAGDVAVVTFSPQPGPSVGVSVAQGSQPLGSTSVPMDLYGGILGRVLLGFDASASQLRIEDSLGTVHFTATLVPPTQPFQVRVLTSNYALVDDVTLFDSLEDGVTPQGVVFWVAPTGQAGFAVHAPQVPLLTLFDLYYNGQLVAPTVANLWYQRAMIVEMGASPFVMSGQSYPTAIHEAIYESIVPAAFPTPGNSYGLRVRTALGADLMGIWQN